MYTIRRAAEILGLSYSRTLELFHMWLRYNGRDPKEFRFPFWKRKNPGWRYIVPEEFIEWAKKRKHENFPAFKPHPKTLADYARHFGVSKRRVRTAFKWYCVEKGIDPKELYRPGYGYVLPDDFGDFLKKYLSRS